MEHTVYQLHIHIDDSNPKIWRRLLISPTETLENLHRILQTLFGWHNSHLHQFVFEDTYYCPQTAMSEKPRVGFKEYSGIRIEKLFKKEKQVLNYDYDFGDDWNVIIQLEKIIKQKNPQEFPECSAGNRRGPLEDSGGIWSYQDRLKTLKNPQHKSYADTREFVGENFDPESIHRSLINEALRSPNFGCL